MMLVLPTSAFGYRSLAISRLIIGVWDMVDILVYWVRRYLRERETPNHLDNASLTMFCGFESFLFS